MKTFAVTINNFNSKYGPDILFVQAENEEAAEYAALLKFTDSDIDWLKDILNMVEMGEICIITRAVIV